MARLIERILVWVAALITVAAVVAVIVNFVPGSSGLFGWLHSGPETAPGELSAIDRAEAALARGDGSGALHWAGRAVTENSSDAGVDNRAGNVALRLGDQRAAERYYLAGESADIHYPWNFVALGQLYARQGKQQLADGQLRAASVSAPDLPFVHYDLGIVELQEHLYAAALADFDAELKRSPTYRPATIGRAEALDKMGRRGEAVAMYRRAGVNQGKGNVKPPKLVVAPLASPTPVPSPSLAPSPSPSPPSKVVLFRAPSPTPTAARATPLRPAASAQTPAIIAVRPPWATAPSNHVAATPKPLGEVAIEARSYVLGVGQDLSFTRALPATDPSLSTAELRTALQSALARKPMDEDGALRIGTAALLSGRLAMASNAFAAVTDGAPRDWRGPYLAGLTAQANGDIQLARASFNAAISRQPRAEAYTSLALASLQDGDTPSAAADARQATALDPSYEPGRFVAGMIDLIQSDVRGAQTNLAAAVALGGAPSRTSYFLNAL